MFAKYILVITIYAGGLLLQCMAQDVPFTNLGLPVPTVDPKKPGEDQDHIGSGSKPELSSSDHNQFTLEPHGHHADFFHNVPPAPEPSATNYIATLNYGEGYPTVIYHCSLTEHKPTTPFVHSPNGHVCTVSFLKDQGHFHAHDEERIHENHKNPLAVLLDLIRPPHQERNMNFPFSAAIPMPVLFG